MAADTDAPVEVVAVKRPLVRRILRWTAGLLLAIVLLVVIAIAWLQTSSGRQFIVDRIAGVAPASGMTVSVGRIEGSPLWSATLYDVKLRDADHKLFLEVPQVELNWRPYRFLYAGLDIRHLVLHHGTLYGKPRLNPGPPNSPTLPNFDIRIDKLVIDQLKVAKGFLGEERIVSARATTNIRRGLVYVKGDGDFGGGDVLHALVYAEPDGDRFDLNLDYRAPAGGLLAGLVGSKQSMRARIIGKGTWTKWDGAFVFDRGATHVSALKLYNRKGVYTLLGQLRPSDFVTGLPARALGPVVDMLARGTLKDSVLDGLMQIRGHGISSEAHGKVDLANNVFEMVQTHSLLLDKDLFGPGVTVRDAVLDATLDGKFRSTVVPHTLTIGELEVSGTKFERIVQRGMMVYDGVRYVIPVNATVARITSGNAMLDPKLVGGRITGTLAWYTHLMEAPDLAVDFPGLKARLAFVGDLQKGAYGLAGPVHATGITLQNLGVIDTDGRIKFAVGSNTPWQLTADLVGRMPRVTNATLANLAGGNVRFRGGLQLGAGRPVVFRHMAITANKLSVVLDGKVLNGVTTLAGSGRQADYGAFTVEATVDRAGLHATLVFANPYPSAGLKNVKLTLSPTANGFHIQTEGQSMLGPFSGSLVLTAPPRGPTRIEIEKLNVWKTSVSGALTLGQGGATGTLHLAGGGLDGSIALTARGGGEAFDVNLVANEAQFAGPTPFGIRRGTIRASGFVGKGNWTVNGTVNAAGVSYGDLFIGRLEGKAQITNGTGTFAAQLAGRRGTQFDLSIVGDASPNRIRVAARGTYAGRDITMPRYAVLTRTADGGWQLAQTQVNFAGGTALVEGRFGGKQPMQGRVSLANMPLSLADTFGANLGLGGTISGIVDIGSGPGGLPVGEARVLIKGLTRSGLVLSSRPIDLALVARLDPTLFQARAALKEGAVTRGQLQARIDHLPPSGPLMERLFAGNLFAQLRYTGPADALWRLFDVEVFDVTGPLEVAADVTGTLANPQVRGSVAGDGLRVQSSLTGTDVQQVSARGNFAGSRFQLTSFTGATNNGGKLLGSGIVDLSNMDRTHGPQLDLRLAARDAEVINLANMGATVTGPIRIISNGAGGTIAGRLQVDEARWVLGGSAAAAKLPNIKTREINLPPDLRLVTTIGPPWTYLIDAHADGGIKVTGMGLDSEWQGDVRLRGTTDNPRIGGEVTVVPHQGFYSFAGTRFDLTRGVIDFDQNSPPDPRINIQAEAKTQSLDVTVSVIGNSSRPQISFMSDPALPEEEVLTRLLFGDSITKLTATDALQLGAALASLRGGGGMDPLNRLRSSIGLDRLRILPADPALNRGTAVALGKNFGRKVYVEIVTDGRSYNATQLEYRLTNWLTILATVSTVGRHSITAEYSRDY